MAGVTTIRWCTVAKSVNNPGRKRRLDQPLERSRARRPTYDPEVFGAMSERVARRIGSWAFIAWMTVVVITWIGWNVLAPDNLKPDIFPFIFLTLLLSLQASYAAPLILLAQNRDLLEEISARLDRIESAQVPDRALPVASDNDPHQQ